MAVQTRRLVKQIVASLIYYTGLFDFICYVKGLKGWRVTIVTFHRVGGGGRRESADSLPTLFVTGESFEGAIRFFRKKFSPICFSDFLRAAKGQAKVPRNPILITFDDGYEDNYTHAFPVLKKFRVPATFFLTSFFIDSDETFWWDRMFHALKQVRPGNMREDLCAENCSDVAGKGFKKELREKRASEGGYDAEEIDPFLSRLWDATEEEINQALVEVESSTAAETVEFSSSNRMLNWNQVREMKESGMTFGSHSRTHVNLNRVAKARLMEEVIVSKREIERNLGEEILFFAYPGGRHSEDVQNAVVESGYRCACTTEPGVNDAETNVFRLKRINIWQGAVSGVKGGFSQSLLAMHLLRQGRNRSKMRR